MFQRVKDVFPLKRKLYGKSINCLEYTGIMPEVVNAEWSMINGESRQFRGAFTGQPAQLSV
jgi:hypothetical protein